MGEALGEDEIIELAEEQLRVSKREVTKKSRTEIVREPVRLRSERVEIERLQGRDLNNPNVEERDSDGRSNPDRDV
jgi:hypothetical protein